MRDRIIGLLERADLAIASCTGVVDDDALGPLIDSVRNARTRLAYPEEILVVALAGGTGSGKSSLLNAMVGAEIVESGGVRPTTSQPEAAVPTAWSTAMSGYFDRIGVVRRHSTALEAMCVIDLPDIDSIEMSHHHRVDQLLPKVDLVVWVTDPEKYKDARLHDDYLQPLAAWSSQFLFVVNQADRLSPDQMTGVLADLVDALGEDGIDSPTVLATAASPAIGAPYGVDDLLAAIAERMKSRDVLYDKVLADLRATAHELESQTGGPSDYDARADLVKGSVAVSLANGDLGQATTDVVGFLSDLSAEAGGATGDSLRRLAANAPQHLVRIDGGVLRVTQGKSRWWRSRASAAPGPDAYQPGLDEAIFRPARALLAKRAVAMASVAEFGVEVESLRSDSRR